MNTSQSSYQIEMTGVSRFARFTFRVNRTHTVEVVISTAESSFTAEMALMTGTLPTEHTAKMDMLLSRRPKQFPTPSRDPYRDDVRCPPRQRPSGWRGLQ